LREFLAPLLFGLAYRHGLITQLWDDSPVEMIAIHYHESIGSQECDMQEEVESH
jgi:hypothetical protein